MTKIKLFIGLMLAIFILSGCGEKEPENAYDLFAAAENNFAQTSISNPCQIIRQETRNRIVDENGITITEISIVLNAQLDLNDNYFYLRTETQMLNISEEVTMIIEEYNDRLILSTQMDNKIQLSVVDETIQTSDLLEEYGMSEIEIGSLTDIKFTKIDDYTFEFNLDLMEQYENLGLDGLLEPGLEEMFQGKIILNKIIFSEDYLNYTLIQTIDGISVPQTTYEMNIRSVTTVENTTEITKLSAFNHAETYYVAPVTKEDLILSYVEDETQLIFLNNSRNNWIKYNLEPGYYELYDGYSDSITSVRLYKENNASVSISERNIFHITEGGAYYFNIACQDETEYYIRVVNLQINDLVYETGFDINSGTITGLNENENDYSIYAFTQPTEARQLLVVKISSLSNQDASLALEMFGKTCTAKINNYCYFVVYGIEPETKLKVTGGLETEYSLDYHLINAGNDPDDPSSYPNISEINWDNPAFVTLDHRTFSIIITIEEGKLYALEWIILYGSGLKIDIFNPEGEIFRISSDLQSYPPGDYILRFSYWYRSFEIVILPILTVN